jgi:hypothetical protein
MKLEITAIANIGDTEKERIVLKAMSDLNLGRFAIFRTNARGEKRVLGGSVPDVYWFANVDLKERDLVILYTKSGTKSTKAGPGGQTSHFFYWGLSKSLWSDQEKFSTVLVETPRWATYKIPEAD